MDSNQPSCLGCSSDELLRYLSSERKEYYDELRSITQYQGDLPLHFLVSIVLRRYRTKDPPFSGVTHLKSEILGVAFGKLSSGFVRLVRHQLQSTWELMIVKRDEHRAEERRTAAVQLQSFARGLRGKAKARQIRHSNQVEKERELLEQRKLAKQMDRGALAIQKSTRAFLGRALAASLRSEVQSARIIQKAWNRKVALTQAKMEVGEMRRRDESATCIQKNYRRFRAHVLSRYLLHRRTQEVLKRQRLATRRNGVESYFEKCGAALAIQRAWRQQSNRHQSVVIAREPAHSGSSSVNDSHKLELATAVSSLPVHSRFYRARQDQQRRNERARKYAIIDAAGGGNVTTAAMTIQRSWRLAASKIQKWKLIRKFYRKMLQGDGACYWHNTKTGISTWTKPKLFDQGDIENPIQLPSPDRSLERTCDLCGKAGVEWYNAKLREGYCGVCNQALRSKGRHRGHDIPLRSCIHCETQVASKQCLPCRDWFCDTCYFDQHSTGNMKLHPYQKVHSHCMYCDEYVALVRIESTLDEWNLCRSCHQLAMADELVILAQRNNISQIPIELVPETAATKRIEPILQDSPSDTNVRSAVRKNTKDL